MVYRGPQSVQFVNAYPNRRFVGSQISRRHAPHVAMSGDTSANSPGVSTLSRRTNEASPSVATSATSTVPTRASGGASSAIAATNRSTAALSPSTSATNPAAELCAYPVNASPRATRYTNGRKPTPCTTPPTVTRTRLTSPPPVAQERHQLGDPDARLRRGLKQRHLSETPPRHPAIELHRLGQIDLRQHRRVGRRENGWVLQRLVLALGDR